MFCLARRVCAYTGWQPHLSEPPGCSQDPADKDTEALPNTQNQEACDQHWGLHFWQFPVGKLQPLP